MHHTKPESNQLEETVHQRNQIIGKIKNIQHPYMLEKIEATVEDVHIYQQLFQHQQTKEILLDEAAEDHSVKPHAKVPLDSKLARYNAWSARPMFYLAMLALLMIGTLITALKEENLSPFINHHLPAIAWTLAGLELFFIADFLTLLYLKKRSDQPVDHNEFVFRCLALIFPPARIGSRDIMTGEYIWIPFWHWAEDTAGLLDELQKRFIIPMIGVALLMVPVLVVEWKFMEDVQSRWPDLNIHLIMEIIETIVWASFAFEFVLLISVAHEKLNYAKDNWIDLLIILLPFVSFLRTFRISQIARLKYATRSFKLRGVMTKTKRGLFFFNFLQRIFRIEPESELRRLQKLLRENELERKDLQEKLLATSERLTEK